MPSDDIRSAFAEDHRHEPALDRAERGANSHLSRAASHAVRRPRRRSRRRRATDRAPRSAASSSAIMRRVVDRRRRDVAERTNLSDRHRSYRASGRAARTRAIAASGSLARANHVVHEHEPLLRVRAIHLAPGAVASARRDRTSPTTPTIVAQSPRDPLPNLIRSPIGSRPGQKRRAIAALIRTTGGASRVSVGRKRRPRSKRNPHRAEIVADHRSPDHARMRWPSPRRGCLLDLEDRRSN